MSWQGPYRDTPTGPAAVHTVPGQWPTDQPKGILASRTAGQATTWDGTPTSSQSYRRAARTVGSSKTEVGDRLDLLLGPLGALGFCQPDGSFVTSLDDRRNRGFRVEGHIRRLTAG